MHLPTDFYDWNIFNILDISFVFIFYIFIIFIATQIKNGERYVIGSRGLTIRNVAETDDGIYTCRAAVIETGELLERNIRVEVLIKPIVSTFSEELEAIEDEAFSVFCNATGKPAPQFTWVKDHSQLNVAHADRWVANSMLSGLN